MSPEKKHQRINETLLGPLERPALQWLAAHMPARMTPDKLTAIGVVGALLILFSYGSTTFDSRFLWLATLGFIINWFGDSLDGTLARFRDIERPKYGYFIDHTVDSLNETLIVLGLGFSPYVRFDVACLALIGYLLMSVMVFIRTYVEDVFQISYGRLGPTEVRVILIALNTIMFFARPEPITLPLGTFSVYDVAVGAIALLLVGIYVSTVYRQGIALREEAERDAVRQPAEA